MRSKVLAVLCALALSLPLPALAQETEPGDPCTTAGLFRATGGVENPDGHFLFCDGSAWQPILGYSSPEGWVMFSSGGLAAAPLHVEGEAIIRRSGLACGGAAYGALRYTSSTDSWEYCDGSAWVSLDNQSACDDAPDGLNFPAKTDMAQSVLATSSIALISGVTCATATVAITGDGTPEYQICSTSNCSTVVQPWTVANGVISSGQYIQLRLTTSGSLDTTSTATLNVGGTNYTWNVKTIGPKRVFVTSTTYDGNLGGLSGADSKCQARADAAGLPGTFKAWLSNSTTNAADRLDHSTVDYVMTNGTVVANGWSDLTDGSLDAGICRTETGTQVNSCGFSYAIVWSNTAGNGTKLTSNQGSFCLDWTSNQSGEFANLGGGTNITDSYWTYYAGGTDACNVSKRLYCFEQETGTPPGGGSGPGQGGGSAAGQTGEIQFNSGNYLATDPNFVFTSTGSLGVGTTTPSATLSVDGAALVTGHAALGSHAAVGSVVWAAGDPINEETYSNFPTGLLLSDFQNGDLSASDWLASAAVYPSYKHTGTGSAELYGIDVVPVVSSESTGPISRLNALYAAPNNFGAGDIQEFFGLVSYLPHYGSGVVAEASTLKIYAPRNHSTGTINSGYGIHVGGGMNSGGGAFNDVYGVYIADQSGVASGQTYNLYSAGSGTNYFAGNIGIGDMSPDHRLDVAGNMGIDAGSYVNFGDTDGSTGYGIRDNAGVIECKNSAGSWAPCASGTPAGANTQIQFNSGGAFGAGADLVWDNTTSGLTIGANSNSGELSLYTDDMLRIYRRATDGNTTKTGLQITRTNTSGAGANNIGADISFVLETTTNGTNQNAGYIALRAQDAAAGTIDSNFGIVPYFNGAAVSAGGLYVEGISASSVEVGINNTSPGAALDISAPSTNTSSNFLALQVTGAQSTANTAGYYAAKFAPTYTASSGNTLAEFYGANARPENTGSGAVTEFFGLYSVPLNSGTGAIANMFGASTQPWNASSGTVGNMYGIYAEPTKQGTGAVTMMYGLYSRCRNQNATGAVTNCYGLYLDTPVITGAITNKYGVYQTDANTINYFNGNVGIGTVSPNAPLEVAGEIKFSSSGLSCASVALGAIRYSSDTVEYCAENGGSQPGPNSAESSRYQVCPLPPTA